MIPIPTDMPGAVTIIWFLCWLDAMAKTIDFTEKYCGDEWYVTWFYLSITTITMIIIRIFITWVWL